MSLMIETPRLYLQNWSNADSDRFAALHSDPEVMADLGGPISRAESNAKLKRYRAAFDEAGISRFAVKTHSGAFVGYAGIMPRNDHFLRAHYEVGWRLLRRAWGLGFATEAAKAALRDAFERKRLTEVLSYTSTENTRSQSVMARIGMERDESRDFTAHFEDVGEWNGLVWVAKPPIS